MKAKKPDNWTETKCNITAGLHIACTGKEYAQLATIVSVITVALQVTMHGEHSEFAFRCLH